jgi:hypothetical protein
MISPSGTGFKVKDGVETEEEDWTPLFCVHRFFSKDSNLQERVRAFVILPLIGVALDSMPQELQCKDAYRYKFSILLHYFSNIIAF